jgi:SSS family transporter
VHIAISNLDLTIVVVYLLATVAFGLAFGQKQGDVKDYLLGGGKLPWWALLGSIVGTETSTATFLSVPGLAYAANGGDLRFLQLSLGYIVGRFVVVLLILPHYFRGELLTSYEVLNSRFGGPTKMTASLLFLVTRNLADGLRLYLAAIVLEQVAGLPLTWSVIVMGVVILLFTFFGGMRSVVWNDCVQLVVYLGGAVLAGAIIVSRLPGGWQQFVEFGSAHDKFRMLDFSTDLTQNFTFWSGLVGGMFLTMGTHGTDQLMVQRLLGARSCREAGFALSLSGLFVFVQFLLFLLLGVGLAAYFAEFPPTAAFASNDQVFATFIVSHMPVGAVGLTLAAVLAAALSSSLNAAAAAAMNDIYRPFCRTPPSPDQLMLVTRVLTVVFGFVQIGVGIAGQHFSKNVVNDVLAIAGFTTGIILGVFLLGILTRHVSQKAALVGLVGGLAIMTGIKFGTTLAWPWFTIVGSSATFGLGLMASVLFPIQVAKEAEV